MNGQKLLDALIGHLHLKNDAALARTLEVEPPVISKLRHCKIAVSAAFMLKVHDKCGLQIKEIRRMGGLLAA